MRNYKYTISELHAFERLIKMRKELGVPFLVVRSWEAFQFVDARGDIIEYAPGDELGDDDKATLLKQVEADLRDDDLDELIIFTNGGPLRAI